MSRRPPTLLRAVAVRILAFALLAMVVQTGVVFSDYWFDDAELGRILLEQETALIAGAIRVEADGGVEVELTKDLRHRYAVQGAAADREIFYRVRAADGTVLLSACDARCTALFLPLEVHPPDLWQRQITPGKPVSVAGGRAFLIGGQRFLVELALIGDPNRLIADVLLHEMVDHMLIPMAITLLLVVGATLVTIRQNLRPVSAAAKAADRLNPELPGVRLPTEGMPLEARSLVEAVNRLLARLLDLIGKQKLFTAAIAHEIRTPVAVVRLELTQISDPRARRAEADLDGLIHKLEQLTALARLETVEDSAFVGGDLTELARQTVARLAPYVFDSGRSIGFSGDAVLHARFVPALVELLLTNLIDNAVRHTPPGTEIQVSVTPIGLSVSDSAGSLHVPDALGDSGTLRLSGGLGIGLRIVGRIASLHGWKISSSHRPGQTSFIVDVTD